MLLGVCGLNAIPFVLSGNCLKSHTMTVSHGMTIPSPFSFLSFELMVQIDHFTGYQPMGTLLTQLINCHSFISPGFFFC